MQIKKPSAKAEGEKRGTTSYSPQKSGLIGKTLRFIGRTRLPLLIFGKGAPKCIPQKRLSCLTATDRSLKKGAKAYLSSSTH